MPTYATLAEAQAAWVTADANLDAAYETLRQQNVSIRGSFGNQTQRTAANTSRQQAVEAVDAAWLARRDVENEIVRLKRGG